MKDRTAVRSHVLLKSAQREILFHSQGIYNHTLAWCFLLLNVECRQGVTKMVWILSNLVSGNVEKAASLRQGYG
jgi:hypothetical protein